METIETMEKLAASEGPAERSFTVQTTINRPAAEVFDAIVNPESLSKYFVDRTSARLEPGATVVWYWKDWGDYPVAVDEVVAFERIQLRINSMDWRKTETDRYDVTVLFEIESLSDSTTLLKISESGWKNDADGIRASYENCGGWQHMADCLKAWIEHGINIR